MATLSTKLIGDSKSLVKAAKKGESALEKFAATAKKTARETAKAEVAAGKLGNRGMKKVGRGAASANATMVEFSRAVSDAPFGIQGVANNLQQLAQNFANLKKAAADGGVSTFALLKKALLGGGGIVLLISAVTAAWVAYENGLFKIRSASEKLNDAIKKNAENLKKYVEGLRGVASAQLAAQKSSVKELTTLEQLRGQVENTNNSMKLRLDAIDQLRRKYPAYFKDLADEKILNGEVADTYNTLTNAIVKRAKATAANDLLVKNAQKVFELESAQRAQEKENSKNRVAEYNAAQKRLKGEAASVRFYAEEEKRFADKKAEGLTKITEFQKEINTLKGEELELIKEINKNTVIDPGKSTSDSSGPKEALGPIVYKQVEAKNLFPVLDEVQKALEEYGKSSAFRTGWYDILVKPLVDGKKEMNAELPEVTRKLREFNTELESVYADILATAPVDLLSGFAEGLGDALGAGENALKGAGQGLLSAMGGIMVNLGKMAITAGVGVEAVKTTLATLVGAPAIAAGIALVAIGSAFKSGAQSLAKKGSAGGAGGSKGGYSSTYSSGASATFAGSGQVVFRISGQDLVGVLGRVTSKNQKLGGSTLYSS